MIDNIDARSSEIKKNFDDNKDLKKVVLERVIKVLNEARVKFDISKVLKSAAKLVICSDRQLFDFKDM